MKRHLLLAAVIAAPLYLRQREVERRQRLRQCAFETELLRHFGAWTSDADKFAERVYRYTKEVNRELSRAGRP